MSKNKARRITPQILRELKAKGENVVLLTAYDYPTSLIEDKAGVEIVLVGDSLGMAVLGHESTLKVTMTELLIACQAVRRGVQKAMLIADMPFMSYQPSNALAIRNAGRFVSQADVDGVKLEGAGPTVNRIRAVVDAGIPVMGHIGFTPQSLKKFGGYKVRGKTDNDVKQLVNDATALEKAGVFCIIVECVVDGIVSKIKEKTTVPIYGIGAGSNCDGQILVIHDMVGLFPGFLPKYVKRYVNLSEMMEKAIREYAGDVKEGRFPGKEHIYK